MDGCVIVVIATTFNNFKLYRASRSVLLVEKIRVPGEIFITFCGIKYRAGFELTILVAIFTHCIGSCKSNYRTITTDHDGPYQMAMHI
jgi:hypothetical protein